MRPVFWLLLTWFPKGPLRELQRACEKPLNVNPDWTYDQFIRNMKASDIHPDAFYAADEAYALFKARKRPNPKKRRK